MPWGDEKAVQRVAPAPFGSGRLNAAFRTAAAVDGSASWSIPGAGLGLPGCWITITNIGANATDILCFSTWASNDGAHPNVNTAGDKAIPPGASEDWWCESGVDRVKFGGPVTAIASHHRSSL